MQSKKISKIELLAPAGSPEKLRYALHYGADAVYAGVPDFSLRARINNFDEKTLEEGVVYVHKKKKKIYVTLNIYAHNNHLKNIERHLKFLEKLKVDGIIVSDPGIIQLIKKHCPKTEIHLSTQANATNWQAVKFWHEQGVKRVVLGREVTLEEIKEIKKNVPKMELEYFVHGAMCMSYSGRCILSKWMTGRSANLGDCAQPCRWRYAQVKSSKYKAESDSLSMSVRDEKERFEIDLEEDRHGTYFFNSYDLNLIEHLKDLMEAGVDSFKIEGRAKSVYYISIVCRAYKRVMDALEKRKDVHPIKSTKGGPAAQEFNGVKKSIAQSKKDLELLVNRGYTKGFLLGNEPEHNFFADNFKNSVQFVGEVTGSDDKLSRVKVHNEIFKNDTVEAVAPEGDYKLKIKKIYNHNKQEITEAHGGHKNEYFFEFDKVLSDKTLIRKNLK